MLKFALLAGALAAPLAASQQTPFGQPYPGAIQLYGKSSGTTASPSARLYVFGFPAKGSQVELHLHGGVPNAPALFYISGASANDDIPGLGIAGVDIASAITLSSTTDANGDASVNLTIPSALPNGAEFYIQAASIDAQGAIPLADLTNAAYVEVGDVDDFVSQLSHVHGTATIGGTVAAPSAGVVVTEFTPSTPTNTIGADVRAHAGAANFDFQGANIENFRIVPDTTDNVRRWTGATMFTSPANWRPGYQVLYESGGTEYGPYEVTATLTMMPGDIDLALDALPAVDGGPLDGVTVEFDWTEELLGFGSPTIVEDNFAVAADGNDGPTLTPADIEQLFDDSEAFLTSVLSGTPYDIGFFDPTFPTYADFFAGEQQVMLALTQGQASSASELGDMIVDGIITEDEATDILLKSKLSDLIGLKGFGAAIDKVINEIAGDEKKAMDEALKNKKWRKAAKQAGKIVKKLLSAEGAKKLTAEVGKKAAAKAAAKIGAKCIPFIGWAVFAWDLIQAIREQADDL